MASFSALRNDWEHLLHPYRTRDLCPMELCPRAGLLSHSPGGSWRSPIHLQRAPATPKSRLINETRARTSPNIASRSVRSSIDTFTLGSPLEISAAILLFRSGRIAQSQPTGVTPLLDPLLQSGTSTRIFARRNALQVSSTGRIIRPQHSVPTRQGASMSGVFPTLPSGPLWAHDAKMERTMVAAPLPTATASPTFCVVLLRLVNCVALVPAPEREEGEEVIRPHSRLAS